MAAAVPRLVSMQFPVPLKQVTPSCSVYGSVVYWDGVRRNRRERALWSLSSQAPPQLPPDGTSRWKVVASERRAVVALTDLWKNSQDQL
jgi:hypothetical protein